MCNLADMPSPWQLKSNYLAMQALSVFALRDIDLSKIESRPMRSQPLVSDPSGSKLFNFMFHIDFLANLAEERAQNALRQLQVRVCCVQAAPAAPRL